MAEPIDAVLVGAGNRGHFVYGAYALRHPDQLRFVAVAEPAAGATAAGETAAPAALTARTPPADRPALPDCACRLLPWVAL